MNDDNKQRLAKYLYEGEANRQDLVKITKEMAPDLTVKEAYEVQELVLQLREKNGHQRFAPKMGLTSKAKWDQMGVNSPIVGYIFDDMIEENNTVHFDKYIHPKVEPEIAIVLKEPLQGTQVTRQDVFNSIDYVLACVEIIDSRYENFDFTLADVIADNASSKGVIFGKEHTSLIGIDLAQEQVTLLINGEEVHQGSGVAVLEHPFEAIIALAKHLDQRGQGVPTGVPIMTGGMTPAALINKGDRIEVKYSNLENLNIQVL